jgi:hypothetical protein
MMGAAAGSATRWNDTRVAISSTLRRSAVYRVSPRVCRTIIQFEENFCCQST